jgi:hypothetical protein
MKFARLDNAMAVCKAHLDATGTRGTEIEHYLVGYLVVIICAEFDARFKKIVETRAGRTGDAHLKNFVVHACGKIVRGNKVSELTSHLGGFGGTCKTDFHAAIAGTTSQGSYDNIMTNRHTVAHHTTSHSMTFNELERAYADSHALLTAVANALGLSAAEIAALA